MLFLIINLYPLYLTGECIRLWNRANKPKFQHLLVFWFLYFNIANIRYLLEHIWLINRWLILFDIITYIALIMCYIPYFAIKCRKYIILPLMQDLKKLFPYAQKYVIPHLVPLLYFVQKNLKVLIYKIFTEYKFI